MKWFVLAKSLDNNGSFTHIYDYKSKILATDKVQQLVDLGYIHSTDRTQFNKRPCGRGDVRVVMLIQGEFI